MALDKSLLDALSMSEQLESAIEHDEFELYYQPLMDVRDGSTYGVEALIRWNHPERGLLEPAEFIPLAEATGLIVPIGSWVLRQACRDFQLMGSLNLSLFLSVNVSSLQLDQPEFLSELVDVLDETGMPPRLLQLEITEGVVLGDSLRIGALFQAIRALGVRIAFDDFGTGFSSLSYLGQYPADVVKIDQSFVRAIGKGGANADILGMIVRLAHAIGMSVSAEGVENREQAEVLSGFGCNIAQGYLYSRPVCLSAMTALLDSSPA